MKTHTETRDEDAYGDAYGDARRRGEDVHEGGVVRRLLFPHGIYPRTRTHRDLVGWQKAMDLATLVYRLSEGFPSHEQYGLAAQMRRAAAAIPSNLAEGHARRGPAEFARFVGYAEGSLAELDTQLRLAHVARVCHQSELASVFGAVTELKRILRALHRELAKSSHSG